MIALVWNAAPVRCSDGAAKLHRGNTQVEWLREKEVTRLIRAKTADEIVQRFAGYLAHSALRNDA